MQVTLQVNGEKMTRDVVPHRLLVDFLREDLSLTGTHVGCDTSQCGACNVLLDGEPIKACSIIVAQAAGRDITTIEGLKGKDGGLHPMQQAFKGCHGLQCGFCTPGMIITGIGILARNPHADEHEIRKELEGNLCRCTGYQNIVAAIARAAIHAKL